MPETPETVAALAAARSAFSGGAVSIQEAIGHLDAAVGLGSAEALTCLAHFVGAGVHQPADWDRAADMLRDAAARGDALAADELRVLASGAGANPAEARANLDIRACIAPRPVTRVSQAPRISVVRSFMSPAECRWLIARGRERLEPATVYDKAAHGQMRVDERSNSSAAFGVLDVDLVQVLIAARMANTIGLPSHWFEAAALLHYAPGQQFTPHYDFLDNSTPGYAADLAQRGQRIATLLVYLNEDYEGGETAFPKLGYSFKGRTGDLLIFANVTLDGAPDVQTLHAGMPTTRGEKWLLSQWVRDRPAR